MTSVKPGRRQFRSKSVASPDPTSPYFTCQSSKTTTCPSISYESKPFVKECDIKRKGKNADIPGLNLKLSPNDPRTSTIRQHYYPEGGWGWVVLLCALTSHFLANALHMTSGFFILAIQDRFLKGQFLIEPVILGSFSCGTTLFLSPIIVALCRRKSTRLIAILGGLITSLGCLFSSFSTQLHQLYLSYGLIVAVGQSLVCETAAIMIGQYFKKRRELIEIIVIVGHGLSSASMPVLVTHWIRNLGWRKGLQMLAGLQSMSCLIAVLYRSASLYHPQRRAILHIKSLQKRSKAKDRMPTSEKRPFFDFTVLKSRTVQILMLGTGITAAGITSPQLLLMYEAQKDHLQITELYILQIFLGLSTSVGAVGFGLLVLKNNIQCMIAKQYLCQTTSFLISGWLLTFPTLTGYYRQVLFVWVYGILYGGYLYSLKLCVFEKVRARNFVRSWSFIQWCQAIPTAIGIPLTGYINNTYGLKKGFYLSSALAFVGSSILFLIDLHKNQVKLKKAAANAKSEKMQVSLSRVNHCTPHEVTTSLMQLHTYNDVHKAQELTCISEEVLVEHFLEDYIDDCITSCNKEEKFLMLSEYENNLFKTEETLEKEKIYLGYVEEKNVFVCHGCPLCTSINHISNNDEPNLSNEYEQKLSNETEQ